MHPSATQLEIRQRLVSVVAPWWRGERISPGGLVFGLNTQGRRHPLLWCFQGYREFSQLAARLGPDQPLYGMRSGHMVFQYSEANIRHIADCYTEEILALDLPGPYLVAGNCQASYIAQRIAENLMRLDLRVAALILLNPLPPLPYAGRVALIVSQHDEAQNPYKRFHDPASAWEDCYLGYTVDSIPGGHGKAFEEPAVSSLVERLEAILPDALRRSGDFAPPACRIDISVPEHLEARPGTRLRLPVTLSNRSPFPCPATRFSQIWVANHWRDPQGGLLHWLDGRTALDSDIPTATALELELVVQVPEQPGQYCLEVDLVKEGSFWFGDLGEKTGQCVVSVQSDAEPDESAAAPTADRVAPPSLPTQPAADEPVIADELESAHRAFGKGDFERAIPGYYKALDGIPVAYQRLGEALLHRKRWDEAKTQYLKALALSPGNPDINAALGELAKQSGDWHTAIHYFDQALAQRPSAPAYASLGELREKTGDFERAKAAYDQALALSPTLLDALRGAIRASRALTAYEEALGYVRRGFEIAPDDNGFLMLEVDIHVDKGDLDTAHALCRKYRRCFPDHPGALVKLGDVLARQGQLQDAEGCLRRAIELDPVFANAHHNLGRVLARQGRLAEAVASARQAIELAPRKPGYHVHLGNLSAREDRLTDAEDRLRRAIELDPGLANAHHDLSRVLARQGKLAEAAASARRAIELDPRKPGYHVHLGNLSARADRWADAEACLRRAVELDPSLASAHHDLSRALARQARLAEATASAKRATELDPAQPGYRAHLDALLLQTREPGEASR